MEKITESTLGELISVFYEEFLALYKDPDIASVATAATINDMLLDAERATETAQPDLEAA